MNHSTYKPSLHLQDFVYCYILMDSDFTNSQQESGMHIYPNGLSGITFTFGEDFIYQNSHGESYNFNIGAAVIGLHTDVFTLKPQRVQKQFTITFKPGILSKLLGVPMNELRNTLTDLNYFTKSASHIPEQLALATSIQQKLHIVEDWLIQHINNFNTENDLSSAVFSSIVQHYGDIKISKLCNQFNVNIKNVERKFQTNIGISPKKCAEIIKFNLLVKSMLSKPKSLWSELCAEAGFIDYSHLGKHTKTLTSLHPNQLKEKIINSQKSGVITNLNLGVTNSLCMIDTA